MKKKKVSYDGKEKTIQGKVLTGTILSHAAKTAVSSYIVRLIKLTYVGDE